MRVLQAEVVLDVVYPDLIPPVKRVRQVRHAAVGDRPEHVTDVGAYG